MATKKNIALKDNDVIVVTQKIVSKVENRLIENNFENIVELIEKESLEILRKRGDTIIARTKHGFICANAGIDKSNIKKGSVLLLPEDPDKTSRDIQKKIEEVASNAASQSRVACIFSELSPAGFKFGFGIP